MPHSTHSIRPKRLPANQAPSSLGVPLLNKLRVLAATILPVALVVGLALIVGGSTPAAAAGGSGQLVTVRVSAAASTTAQLDLWQRQAGGSYAHVYGPVGAHVGADGVGLASESSARTPAGVYSLTQAFGNQANNGTLLPYFRAGWSDWWNENPASPGYNTHVHQSNSPGGNSENLAAAGSVYSHAVVIDYNRWPARPGAGSGFFLHVTNGRATAGCVAISSANLDVVMRWLNPSQHPAISIGIGAQAIAPINRANAAAAAHNPFGSLDAGTAHGRQVRVTGWAADPDNRAAPLSIAVYYDGHGIGWFHSGVVRPDVQRIRHTGPRQGYDITVHLPPGRHQVCTYAINIGAGAGNPKLGCRTVTAA